MADEKTPELPADKGRFGKGAATEDYKPLEHPDVSSDEKRPKGGAQRRTEAGERS